MANIYQNTKQIIFIKLCCPHIRLFQMRQVNWAMFITLTLDDLVCRNINFDEGYFLQLKKYTNRIHLSNKNKNIELIIFLFYLYHVRLIPNCTIHTPALILFLYFILNPISWLKPDALWLLHANIRRILCDFLSQWLNLL